jgi:hypothetical protein
MLHSFLKEVAPFYSLFLVFLNERVVRKSMVEAGYKACVFWLAQYYQVTQ